MVVGCYCGEILSRTVIAVLLVVLRVNQSALGADSLTIIILVSLSLHLGTRGWVR